MLGDGWSVPSLLQIIATSSVFRALIDTGALITGFSNQEVAAELLRRGLPWCDGIVFLDDADKQQVLVRATGRVVSADQCGVPLERRFAFYDQIHTTGMDIKHVVNATAVITLGKDMVFRDYVQGAYRMRGIGKGQKIHCLIIPEVAQLMAREAKAAHRRSSGLGSGVKLLKHTGDATGGDDDATHFHVDDAAGALKDGVNEAFDIVRQSKKDPSAVLRQIVAWLVVNSMRSEQIQWSMLCIQNVGNVFRKTAFEVMLRAGANVAKGADPVELGSMQTPLDVDSQDPVDHLSAGASVEVFTEPIDFSLDSAVPDPAPFEVKLRKLLEDHHEFIPDAAAHAVGQEILNEVGRYSNLEGTANRLESEQEREQEQEQQKEVKARRDQQVEIEKFVDREYSRNNESPKPWPLSALLKPPPLAANHVLDDDADEDLEAQDSPFYRLRRFKLRHQESLRMPGQLLCSRNYFNPHWSGLRRIKNVIMILEWAPEVPKVEETDAGQKLGQGFRLLTPDEHTAAAPEMTAARQDSLQKAFLLLSGARADGLGREELTNAIQAITDAAPTPEQIAVALAAASAAEDGTVGGCVTMAGFEELLNTRNVLPMHKGRYYVAVSLAEAETIRRVLHVRGNLPLIDKTGGKTSAEVALRYSPLPSPGGATLLGDGGVAFDTSAGWRRDNGSVGTLAVGAPKRTIDNTGATAVEAAVAQSAFRFFDGDMHYSDSSLNVLVRSLQASSMLERERFFSSTVGVRRRMDRKWQETPLAKVFTMADEFAMLKQRAQAVYVREALARHSPPLKKWEAFMAFDSDDNGLLGPAEIYGALRYLGMPDLTPDDVIDFLEAGDVNRDSMLDYKEWLDLLNDEDDEDDDDDGKVEDTATPDATAAADDPESSPQQSSMKVEAYGAEEIREVLAARRRKEQEELRAERIRRETRQAELEHAIFEEELAASASRVGGANPDRRTPAEDPRSATTDEATGYYSCAYKFDANKSPLRTVVTGKEVEFRVVMSNALRQKALAAPITCPGCKEVLRHKRNPDRYEKCKLCRRSGQAVGGGVEWKCKRAWHYGTNECYRYFLCNGCYKGQRTQGLHACSDPTHHETYLHCPAGTSLSLLLPAGAVFGLKELGHKLHTAAKQAASEWAAKAEPEVLAHQVATSAILNLDGTACSQAKVRWLLDTPAALGDAMQAALLILGSGETPPDDAAELHHDENPAGDVSYSVVVEFRLPALPQKGHRAALLRFAPPPIVPGRQVKRQEATVYVDSDGQLLGNSAVEIQSVTLPPAQAGPPPPPTAAQLNGEPQPEPEPEPEQKSENPVDLKKRKKSKKNAKRSSGSVSAGQWQVLVASVDCREGKLSLYVDGVLTHEGGVVADQRDAGMQGGAALSLGTRFVLLGGGKQSECRGGDVRKVRGARLQLTLVFCLTDKHSLAKNSWRKTDVGSVGPVPLSVFFKSSSFVSLSDLLCCFGRTGSHRRWLPFSGAGHQPHRRPTHAESSTVQGGCAHPSLRSRPIGKRIPIGRKSISTKLPFSCFAFVLMC